MQFHPLTVQTRVPSPLGCIWLAASPQGLSGLWFGGQRHLPAQLDSAPAWPCDGAHPVLQAATLQLQQYFAGTRTRFALPLDTSGGTPFQQAVWHALLGIAHGSTTTYGALARQLGHASAVRAVGAAVGRNPLSLVVPCHRVLGADGRLAGYAGGLERKAHLLALEGASGPGKPWALSSTPAAMGVESPNA